MKVLLDIQESKADFVLELLKSIRFIKIDIISPSKSKFLKELKESIEEVKLHKAGKIQLKTAEELLNEL